MKIQRALEFIQLQVVWATGRLPVHLEQLENYN